MYRRYEDPYKIERLLHEAQTALENAKTYCAEDVDLLITLSNEVSELEQRLNHARQDEKSEMEG